MIEVVQKTFSCYKVSTFEAFTEAAIDRGEDCPRVVSDAAQLPGESLLLPRQQPVFMWCPTVEIGAHHACWLLLQALFMTASVLTTTSTTATRTIIKGVFMVTSRPRPLTEPNFRGSKMDSG